MQNMMPGGGLQALLAALQSGGAPQGQMANLPGILQGLGGMQSIPPELLAMLSPMGQAQIGGPGGAPGMGNPLSMRGRM